MFEDALAAFAIGILLGCFLTTGYLASTKSEGGK